MNSNQFWGIYSMVNDKKKENQTVYLHYRNISVLSYKAKSGRLICELLGNKIRVVFTLFKLFGLFSGLFLHFFETCLVCSLHRNLATLRAANPRVTPQARVSGKRISSLAKSLRCKNDTNRTCMNT